MIIDNLDTLLSMTEPHLTLC